MGGGGGRCRGSLWRGRDEVERECVGLFELYDY